MLGGPQWGIFNQTGEPYIVAESTADLSYARDYLISDAPQTQGAFMSYNKVQVPFDAKVGFLTNQTRFQLLPMLDALVASLQLVSVVSPEVTYPSANLIHYDLRRTATKGKTLILVVVWAREVRIISGVSPTSTQSTNAATPTQSGQVQPTPATGTVAQQINANNGVPTSATLGPDGLPTDPTDYPPTSAGTLTITFPATGQSSTGPGGNVIAPALPPPVTSSTGPDGLPNDPTDFPPS